MMTKIAGALIIVGLGLLLASLFPWPSAAEEAQNGQPVEESTISVVEQGRVLFLAKGCVSCHVHAALGELSAKASFGPTLSFYQPDPDFVRRWLRDPAAIKPGTQMPNLALSDQEIDALIAFLTAAAATGEAKGLAQGLNHCPVTQPADPPFRPPEPDLTREDELLAAPAQGSLEAYFWYGSDSLWTQLRRDGVWRDLPRSDGGYVQKIFFGSEGYNWREEPLPALTVSGRRLDVTGLAFEELEATNGFHPDVGSFMLVGADIPTAGCWEITGHYQGQELSFVVWVAPD
jgi:mono/diheme cytochrome c family protein